MSVQGWFCHEYGTACSHLQLCPAAKIYPRRNRAGSHWYVEFAIPSCGTVHRERIDTTDADRGRGYNRAEHLLQHVKTDDGDSVYDRCYGWREDSESQSHPRPHPNDRAANEPFSYDTLVGFPWLGRTGIGGSIRM